MQTQSKSLNFEGQNIYVGFDAHLKSRQVTILTENMSHRTFVMPLKPKALSTYLKSNIPKGTTFNPMKQVFVN